MSRIHCALFAVMLTAGCGSDPSPSPKVAGDARAESGANTSGARGRDRATPTSGSLHIDSKIQKACSDIPTTHFAFDSSAIQSDAADALRSVARCFATGPLKGKHLKLVGHADSRGEIEYNFALGHRRAGSVNEFLVRQGLNAKQIATSSRGELEAHGIDEDGWAKDRKVEVFLDD